MQEDNDLFHEMIESGDINLKNSTSKVALIYVGPARKKQREQSHRTKYRIGA